MASPQKENGYTAIANELLQSICAAKFNGTQYKIVLCIMRYTYGFSRKSHSLSISFISKVTGVSKRYISAELQRLVEQNVVSVLSDHTDTTSRVLALNKDYKKWFASGTIVHQMKSCSPDEPEQDTTDEELFTTTGEELFIQENKLKTKLKTSIYGEFENVRLTDEEYGKLSARLPGFEKRIEDLSLYLAQTGKKYKSHYATILSWARKDGVELKKPEKPPEPERQFESEEQRQAQLEFVRNLGIGNIFKTASEEDML